MLFASMLSALIDMPFASSATLDQNPTGLRRSMRSRAPSVRLGTPDDDEVQQVLHAGGDVVPLTSREAVCAPTATAFQEALRLLSDLAALLRRQQDDARLAQVCQELSAIEGRAGKGHLQGFSTDVNGMLWFEQAGTKLPVVPQSMVTDEIALVHLFHGHVGVGPTLHLLPCTL